MSPHPIKAPVLASATRLFCVPQIGSDIVLERSLKVNLSLRYSNYKALIALGFAQSDGSNKKYGIHFFDPITSQPIPISDKWPTHYTFEFPIGTTFKFNTISIKRNPGESYINVWAKLPGVAKKIRVEIGIHFVQAMAYQQIEQI